MTRRRTPCTVPSLTRPLARGSAIAPPLRAGVPSHPLARARPRHCTPLRAPARPYIRISLVPLGAILAACLGSGAPNLLRPIPRPRSVAAAAPGRAELTLSLGVLCLTLFFSGPTAPDLPRTRGPLCHHSIRALPRFSRSFAIPTSYLIESGSAARETQGKGRHCRRWAPHETDCGAVCRARQGRGQVPILDRNQPTKSAVPCADVGSATRGNKL